MRKHRQQICLKMSLFCQETTSQCALKYVNRFVLYDEALLCGLSRERLLCGRDIVTNTFHKLIVRLASMCCSFGSPDFRDSDSGCNSYCLEFSGEYIGLETQQVLRRNYRVPKAGDQRKLSADYITSLAGRNKTCFLKLVTL